eukprot:4725384-Amphidinium_carterae.1
MLAVCKVRAEKAVHEHTWSHENNHVSTKCICQHTACVISQTHSRCGRRFPVALACGRCSQAP